MLFTKTKPETRSMDYPQKHGAPRNVEPLDLIRILTTVPPVVKYTPSTSRSVL